MATSVSHPPADGIALPGKAYTVTDLLDAYEAEYLSTKAPTTQYNQGRFYLWLRKELGFMLLTDLTPAFLRQWRDVLSKRYAPGTVRRYLDSLSGPLTVAVRDYEWLAVNPLRKVRQPPHTPGRVRFLSDEERVALLAACQVSRNPHLHAIVLLALSTGARKGELLQRRWRELDLVRGVLHIGQSKNKTKRAVAISGPVLTLLRKRGDGQAPDAWVFARHDGRKPILVDGAFVNACKRAGIADFRFHDLRHSAASYLAMSGATLREIQEILGHKTISMSAKYAHLSAGHTASVLANMTRQYFEAPTANPEED